MTDYDLLERAKRLGTEAGCTSARARGLDDWDDEAARLARTVEEAVIAGEERRERESLRGHW